MFHSLTHHSSRPDIDSDSHKTQQVGPCPWCLYQCMSKLDVSGLQWGRAVGILVFGMNALHGHLYTCTVGLLVRA